LTVDAKLRESRTEWLCEDFERKAGRTSSNSGSGDDYESESGKRSGKSCFDDQKSYYSLSVQGSTGFENKPQWIN
jgi:hypothetical protein